ncbi:MAG: hypothetical protein LH624_02580, partial [Cryobacterium sp.]|nr:hypothetical protein [Cryobacterium sp.]
MLLRKWPDRSRARASIQNTIPVSGPVATIDKTPPMASWALFCDRVQLSFMRGCPPVPTPWSSVMVMSGSAERVVFVQDRLGQESLLTGGTIARLRSDDAEVVVLFGSSSYADDSDVSTAMAALDVSDWRMLPAASGPQSLAEAVADVLDEVQATAVVIGADDETLRTATAGAADSRNVPVFVQCRVTDAVGQRLVAIDISAQVDQKLRAIAAYPRRWNVTDRTVEPAEPVDRPVTIGGTETFLRLPSAHTSAVETTPGLLGRGLAVVVALLTGASFGVLGTIAHQATLSFGPVTIPIGLALALAGITALLAGLRLVLGDRTVVFYCA